LPDSDKVRLSVSDSGVGLPTDFVVKRANSLGLQLVTDLARQVGGTLEMTNGPSAQFIVDFVPDIQKKQGRDFAQVLRTA
jgi:two-component sensor histidine kinase